METSREAQAQTGLTFYFLGKTHAGLRKLSAYYRQRGFKVSNIAEPEELAEYVADAPPDIILIDLQSRNDISRFMDALRAADPSTDTPRVAIISSTTDDDTAAALREECDEAVSWPLKATDLSTKLFSLITRHGRLLGAEQDTLEAGASLFRGDVTPGILKPLLQALYLSRRDGVLTMESEGRRGNLWFKEGKLIDAQVGALDWEESLDLIRRFTLGTFTIAFQTIDRRRFIEKNALQWIAQREAEEAAARSASGVGLSDDVDFAAGLLDGVEEDDDDDPQGNNPTTLDAPAEEDEEAYEITTSTPAFNQAGFEIDDYEEDGPEGEDDLNQSLGQRTLPALRALREEEREESSAFGDFEDDEEEEDDDDYDDDYDDYDDDYDDEDDHDEGENTVARVSIQVGRFSRDELEQRRRMEAIGLEEKPFRGTRIAPIPTLSADDGPTPPHIDRMARAPVPFSDPHDAEVMTFEAMEATDADLEDTPTLAPTPPPLARFVEESEPPPVRPPVFEAPIIAVGDASAEDLDESDDYDDDYGDDYDDDYDDFEDTDDEVVAVAALSALPLDPAPGPAPLPIAVEASPAPVAPAPVVAPPRAPVAQPAYPPRAPVERRPVVAPLPGEVQDDRDRAQRRRAGVWLYPLFGLIALFAVVWMFRAKETHITTDPVAGLPNNGGESPNRGLTDPGKRPEGGKAQGGRTEREVIAPAGSGVIPPVERPVQPPRGNDAASNGQPALPSGGPPAVVPDQRPVATPVPATPTPAKTPTPRPVAAPTRPPQAVAAIPRATPTPRPPPRATPVPRVEPPAANPGPAVDTGEAQAEQLAKLIKDAGRQESAGNLDKAMVLYAQAVDIAPGDTRASEGLSRIRQLKAQPAVEPGELFVNSIPYGLVYIDGEKVGYTPVHRMDATPRKYVIRITNPDYGACSVVQEVRPGARTFVHLKLDDDKACGRTNAP